MTIPQADIEKIRDSLRKKVAELDQQIRASDTIQSHSLYTLRFFIAEQAHQLDLLILKGN